MYLTLTLFEILVYGSLGLCALAPVVMLVLLAIDFIKKRIW